MTTGLWVQTGGHSAHSTVLPAAVVDTLSAVAHAQSARAAALITIEQNTHQS